MRGFLEKLSKILLILLLLLIPTQLGKHFWFNWSYVLGIRVDYLSPTLYLIDIVFLILFLSDVLLGFEKIKIRKWLSFKNFLVIGIVWLNVVMSSNIGVASYRWIRIFQLVWFVWYVAKKKRLVDKLLVYAVPFWIILESLLSVAQISNGGSLNGIWWWFGERGFSFNTIGIAQMSVAGNGLIRAYGTFSHPNSLAGFLLVALIIWWKKKEDLNKKWWWMINWLGLTGIVLSGSRTIWFLTTILIVVGILNIFNKKKLPLITGMVILGMVLISIVNFNYPIEDFLGGWDENGWIKRGQLNLAALGMIKESPWYGIGMGNFLTRLPDFQQNNRIFWLQPVHNILLLILSEVGVIGLILFVWKIRDWVLNKKISWNIFLAMGVVVVTGMIDHYWLTLPQNMWLLALVFGII